MQQVLPRLDGLQHQGSRQVRTHSVGTEAIGTLEKSLRAHLVCRRFLPRHPASLQRCPDRNVSFGNSKLAPISVVLTTLAATYYAGENSVSAALTTILSGIVAEVHRADQRHERIQVHNPSHLAEDFAERWDENLPAYYAFKKWIFEFNQAWRNIAANRTNPAESLDALFGEYVPRAEVALAKRMQAARKAGLLNVTSAGIITSAPSVARVKPNVFHGDA